MRYIRTASTRRLLATLAGVVAAIIAGAAIAVAATTGGPIPKAQPLAESLHDAASASPVAGISADITFTNNLIGSTDFTGGASDPILQGATGRLWLSNDGRLRLELQSSNGDSQIVVDQATHRFWVSDPASNTVYEGTLPSDGSSSTTTPKHTGAIPSVAAIQSYLNKLMKHVDLAGASTSDPTDVAGQPAYSVVVSPKHDGGLLGQVQLAWDAVHGVPLDFAVYARGNTTPVLELKADNISYGAGPASDFNVTPPAGDKVVTIATGSSTAASKAASKATSKAAHATHAKVTGVAAVSTHVPFTLAAPSSLVGLTRQDVSLLNWGGSPAALVTYGQGLGGIAVIEQTAPKSSSTPAQGSGSTLSIPTVSINGATGQELGTPLGTILRFSSGGVAYTLLGSVPTSAANYAAEALTK